MEGSNACFPLCRSSWLAGRAEVLTGASEAAVEHGARLVMCPSSHTLWLHEDFLQGAIDAALLISPTEIPSELVSLRQQGHPLVVVDPVLPVVDDVPAVAPANWAGARMATEHLLGLGHTRIGIITGPSGWLFCADRLAGYQAALLANGVPWAPQLVEEAELSVEGGYKAADALLSIRNQPTAIFAMSDPMAVGAIRSAQRRGLRVPRDLSIVGFDDVDMASLVTPQLTTIQQPMRALGRMAIDLLCRLLTGEQPDASRLELSTRLVIRESTGPPHGISYLTV